MPFTQEMELNPELGGHGQLLSCPPSPRTSLKSPFLQSRLSWATTQPGLRSSHPPQQWPSLALHGSQGKVTQGDLCAECSGVVWAGEGFPPPRGTGGARDWQSHSDGRPRLSWPVRVQPVPPENSSLLAAMRPRRPRPQLSRLPCAGQVLDERSPGPFLLQASINVGVSKRILQAGLLSPFCLWGVE